MSDLIHFDDFGGAGPVLHFAHPNAYPPACFKPFLRPLTADYHVIAVHHRPLWPGSDPREFQDWQLITDDLKRFLRQQGLEQIIGVGHSLGAVATMKAAWQAPELFRTLILIEPVLVEPAYLKMLAEQPELTEELPLVLQTRKRRTHWPDRRTAFDSFRRKKVFARWPDDSLWSYVNEGLVDTGEGEVTLAYKRDWEVRFYTRYPDVWEEIPRITHPTLAIRGAESRTLTAEAWGLWQSLQPDATYVEIPDAGHMVPMERPDAVAKSIRTFLSRLD